ncbi:MAG TPA: bifunctional UDP-N-acetylglucosamine diphosphorylase/glucosamine-1-phosphate N-acetyltransferase GlmU, partial [Stellaceae bacterium]|nr:bifunctional UDP-N-acetylglucosamine diphosphorylase/glucosamine-1-phosphate N-acetyltransferase GlmU [Stellaceae bacterium]
NTAILVLAAGQGTRMRSDLPKVMHRLAGLPMLGHVLATARSLGSEIGVVVGPEMASVERLAAGHRLIRQQERLGTGHAVAQARGAFAGIEASTVLVMYGDTPLITPETLARMVETRERSGAAIVVLGMRPEPPGAYGRLVMAGDDLVAIVEAAEASPEQLAIPLCNSGVMAIDGRHIWPLVAQIGNANAKGEYYLTDIVAIARAQGLAARVVEAGLEELTGVNSRAELAAAEAILQRRLRARAMAGGATLIDPDTVYFSADTRLGQDVVVEPNVVFGPKVTIGNRVEIRAFSHIEGAQVADDVVIGPFARLRPGAHLAEGVHVGNFVEIKNTRMGAGAKANHLTYLGDADVGAASNVGAGTITCNYDGFDKFRTTIGQGAFIGSNTALVAPVTVGDGAITAAGSVVTHDVAADALALGRARQVVKPGHAARFRATKRRLKNEG